MHTLYERDYIDGKSIAVTKLGDAVVNALKKYCSEVVSVELTKTFDEEMEAIQEGKAKRETIVKNARISLTKTLEDFKTHEKKIGKELLAALNTVLKEESTIGPCSCGGTLIKRRSHVGKPFVGCSAYPKCTETFSLPHHGKIKPSKKKCDCGLFIVTVKQTGKRPWRLCVRDGFKK